MTWTRSNDAPGDGPSVGEEGEVQISVLKKWEGRYWPRLLRAPKPKPEDSTPDAESDADAWRHVAVDWRRWKAEDDGAPEGPAAEESRTATWRDPDSDDALYAPAVFRTEEFDDRAVPLLRDASHLASFLRNVTGVAAILLFERGTRASMAAHALWASAANEHGQELAMNKSGSVSVQLARLDLGASPGLGRKLHATHAPQARLFRSTGEAHSFDVGQYRHPRELVRYLHRQAAPAWTAVGTPAELLEALETNARTAVFLDRAGLVVGKASGEMVAAAGEERPVSGSGEGEDGSAAGGGEKRRSGGGGGKKRRKKSNKRNVSVGGGDAKALDTFRKVSRKFQARVEASPLTWIIANVSDTVVWGVSDSSVSGEDTAAKMTLAGPEARAQSHLSAMLGNRSVATAGPVLVFKRGEDPEFFAGPWKNVALHDWIFKAQFASVERVTPGNFGYFRERNLPMMYAVLGDAVHKDDPFAALEGMRIAAGKHKDAISFVFTFPEAEGAVDLLRHLRCKPRPTPGTSQTFAVLEDFHNDYRYCVNVGDGNDVSFTRLDDTLREFFAGTLKPDELRSLPQEKRRGANGGAGEGGALSDKQAGDESSTPDSAVFELGVLTELVATDVVSAVRRKDVHVVLHIFADVDDDWERRRYELTKLAEWAETERPDVAVAVMDGLRNERPPDLPELGFIPITLLFPIEGKDDPKTFNATAGFTSDRLKEWVGEASQGPRSVEGHAREEL